MYERFFHLRERPFALSPDPDYLYPSRVHREALGYLRYGLESHAGFVVITGEIGSGKTTLLQALLRGLDSQTTVIRLMNTLLDPRELLEAIAIDLGIDPGSSSKPVLIHSLATRLVEERQAGRMVLLVIDEAQNLGLPALEEIRMLSNLETEKSKLIQIVLVGQPDLRDKLAMPQLEQLRQRITVSYHLEPLDRGETEAYINHRLRRASIGAPLQFSRQVTDLIHDRANGVPRLINVICDAVLVFAYADERRVIDPGLLTEVQEELELTGVLRRRAARSEAAPREEGLADVATIAPAVATAAAEEDFAADTPIEHARPEDILEKEAVLRLREQDVERRELQIVEQQRVLAEEYRLFRTRQAAELSHTTMKAAESPAGGGWPPLAAPPPARAANTFRQPAAPAPQIVPFSAPQWSDAEGPRTGFWQRVRRMFGSPAAVEDRR